LVTSDAYQKTIIQEDYTFIKLNKEHAHSETSGIILFSVTGETDVEFNEAEEHAVKEIKHHLSGFYSLLSFAFQHHCKEVVKCEHFTYRPLLLHIALFLFNADLRI
jgi:hypothetical protein